MVSRRNGLRRRLAAVRAVQSVYMPCTRAHIAATQQPSSLAPDNATLPPDSTSSQATSTATTTDRPEDEMLFLPHELSLTELQGCALGIANIEERLRDAQLHENLDKLRVALHVRARLVTFKNRHVRAQRPNTRARRQIDLNNAKVAAHADKYRAARKAKYALTKGGEWEKTYRPLAQTDVRTMLPEDDPANREAMKSVDAMPMLSEGRRKPSWIWMAADTTTAGGNIHEGLQDGEYCFFYMIS